MKKLCIINRFRNWLHFDINYRSLIALSGLNITSVSDRVKIDATPYYTTLCIYSCKSAALLHYNYEYILVNLPCILKLSIWITYLENNTFPSCPFFFQNFKYSRKPLEYPFMKNTCSFYNLMVTHVLIKLQLLNLITILYISFYSILEIYTVFNWLRLITKFRLCALLFIFD